MKILLHITVSFILSVLFIWGVGYFFCNSLPYYIFDPTLKKLIHNPGIIYKHRSEGFAITYKGLYGVNSITNIKNDKRKKIIIWGDSYVEAHNVNDEFKLPQILTKKLVENKFGQNFMAYGVGMSGYSVADYFFNLPKYEQLTPNTIAHFIILTDINDSLPDQVSHKHCMFRSNPFRLEERVPHLKFQSFKKTLDEYGMYFIWKPFKAVITSMKSINFTPSIKNFSENSNRDTSSFSYEFLSDSWLFLFGKLREHTNTPIIFVYCPAIPKINMNSVDKTDNDKKKILLFKKVAQKHDIPVLDLTEDFISFYDRTGLFPRGFKNSQPGAGHFNENGHKIVAERILKYFIEGN